MKTSASGRAAIEQREGRELKAYRDSVGVLTIGVGHTGRMAPPPVTAGMTITEAQCDAFLAADLAPVEATIDSLVEMPLTQNEFDALASWLFNVGAGDLKRSTILKCINRGDMTGAAKAFDLYHKPPSIIGRRNAEKAQFLRPDATMAPVATARANQLDTMADEAKAKARGVTVAAGVTAAAGAAATSTGVVTGHSTLAVVVGVVAGLATLGHAAFAWWTHLRATTLAANAESQRLLT